MGKSERISLILSKISPQAFPRVQGFAVCPESKSVIVKVFPNSPDKEEPQFATVLASTLPGRSTFLSISSIGIWLLKKAPALVAERPLQYSTLYGLSKYLWRKGLSLSAYLGSLSSEFQIDSSQAIKNFTRVSKL